MRTYTPPLGFYDQPFYYVFDAQSLTDGALAYNQFVNMIPGIGDFVLRRIVGLDRVLQNVNSAVSPAPPNSGQYQFRDNNGAYLSASPIYQGAGGPGTESANTSDLAVIPEIWYPDKGSVRFDLLRILRAIADTQSANPIYSAQLGFGGVRRLPGTSPLVPSFQYKPRQYSYVQKLLITHEAYVPGTTVLQPPQVVNTQITNYDFELYELRITYQKLLEIAGPPDTGGVFALYPNLTNAIPPELLFIDIISPGTPNHALTISVSGGTVTITLQTDGGGGDISTVQQVVNIINGTPAAAALMTAVVVSSPNLTAGDTGGVVTPLLQGLVSSNSCFTALQLYDQNTVATFSIPMLDLYLNSVSYYANGAIVPPLLYKKDSRLRMEVTSLIGDTNANGLYMEIDYIGRQRIPC